MWKGACFPALDRCLKAVHTGTDIICEEYSAAYRTLTYGAFLDAELPDMQVSKENLVSAGIDMCWSTYPGDWGRCEACRVQMSLGGQCRFVEGDHYGCRYLNRHISESCAECEPGYMQDGMRRCITNCIGPHGTICGDHCIETRHMPLGFNCFKWPLANYNGSSDAVPGRPENRHLLKCSEPGACFKCNEGCADCVGPRASDCLSCSVPTEKLLVHNRKIFLHRYVDIGACVPRCPTTTVEIMGHCVACPRWCAKCSPENNRQCLECMRGHLLQPNGTCYTTCPLGFARNYLTSKCEPCAEGCLHCVTNNPSICLACSDPLKQLYAGRCVDDCPVGTFPTEDMVCRICDAQCTRCIEGGVCTACRAGFEPRQGVCKPACRKGSYFSKAKGACDKCAPECKECATLSDNCTSCNPGFIHLQPSSFTESHRCVTACPAGYFHDLTHRRCVPCLSPNCQTCNEEGRCIDCQAGFNMMPQRGQCFRTCPEGYYKQDGVCQPCGGMCATCVNGLPDGCLSCIANNDNKMPYVRLVETPGGKDPGRCTYTCGSFEGYGFYMQTRKARLCRKCPANCLECDVPNALNPDLSTHWVRCKKCKEGFGFARDGVTCVPHAVGLMAIDVDGAAEADDDQDFAWLQRRVSPSIAEAKEAPAPEPEEAAAASA